jgi:Zn-finger protein
VLTSPSGTQSQFETEKFVFYVTEIKIQRFWFMCRCYHGDVIFLGMGWDPLTVWNRKVCFLGHRNQNSKVLIPVLVCQRQLPYQYACLSSQRKSKFFMSEIMTVWNVNVCFLSHRNQTVHHLFGFWCLQVALDLVTVWNRKGCFLCHRNRNSKVFIHVQMLSWFLVRAGTW